MIIFQTATEELNLTNLRTTLTERNDWFYDKISKSFSFPFNIHLKDDIAIKLGLVNYASVSSYKNKIYGKLIIDDKFYEAYISINEIVNDKAEITLFYTDKILSVYDKNLRQLPFPVIEATGGLPTFAKNQISKSWPTATHNFVKIFRDALIEKSNYKHFNGFVNNYELNTTTSQWEFPTNSIDIINGENVVVNRNILAPFPYLMEIFKVIFDSEGLELRGDFVNNELFQKVMLVPSNFLEHFSATQFERYSFTNYTSQEVISNSIINVYTHIHTPINIGEYSLKININLTKELAHYFRLTIKQNGLILYAAFSEKLAVSINETLNIVIDNNTVFKPITVELKLTATNNSIASINSFLYEYKEGQLNIYPTTYTLADFVPDMLVRDFLNKIKNWLNLRIDYVEKFVYINFLEDLTGGLVYKDKSYLQQYDYKRVLRKNNLFILKYLDDQEVIVNNTGQIFDKSNYIDEEITTLNIDILPIEIADNYGTITANYPKNPTDLMFCLYNGLIGNEPLAVDNINTEKITLVNIYNNFWKKWLKFRANAEIIKESFFIHITDDYNLKQGFFKYNKKLLVKSIRKKRVNDYYWKFTVESETL